MAKLAIVGKDVTKDIDGTHIEYDQSTFLNDIEKYDRVMYVGEDGTILKSIAVTMRSANKDLIYIGGIDTAHVMRKYNKITVYTSLKDYPGVKRFNKSKEDIKSKLDEINKLDEVVKFNNINDRIIDTDEDTPVNPYQFTSSVFE